jgi:hypothetical protein
MSAGQPISETNEHQQTIVVVLAGTERRNHEQGILVNCEITQHRLDYLEITCAD